MISPLLGNDPFECSEMGGLRVSETDQLPHRKCRLLSANPLPSLTKLYMPTEDTLWRWRNPPLLCRVPHLRRKAPKMGIRAQLEPFRGPAPTTAHQSNEAECPMGHRARARSVCLRARLQPCRKEWGTKAALAAGYPKNPQKPLTPLITLNQGRKHRSPAHRRASSF